MIRSSALLLCIATAAPAAAKGLAKEMDPLAGKLLDGTELKSRHLAVGDIKDGEGRVTELSIALEEGLEAALQGRAKSAGFKLVDRRHVADLAKEWKLGMLGMIDAAEPQQAGKLLGVDVFCMASYVRNGDSFDVKASFVAADTGQILSTAAGEIKADADASALAEKVLKPAEIATISDSDALKVDIWADSDTLKPGDKTRVYVRANHDCYLTLIDVGTSGSTTVIFPNNYAPSNFAKAGVTYTIPDPSAGFEFEVTGPTGPELVRALASKEPLVELKDVIQGFDAEHPFAEVKDPPVLTRNIHVAAKKAKKGSWSEAMLRITIVEGK